MATRLAWSFLVIVASISTISSPRSFVDAAALSSSLSTSTSQKESFEIPSASQAQHQQQQQDANVRDLESLKHSLGNTLKMMKSHSSLYTNVDGQKEAHEDFREQVESDGKLVARVDQRLDTEPSDSDPKLPLTRVRTDVEIPSEGVHRSTLQNVETPLAMASKGFSAKKRLTIGVSDFPSVKVNNNKLDSYFGTQQQQQQQQYSPMDIAEYVFWTGDEKGVTLGIEEFLREGLMSREEAIDFLQEVKYNLDYLQSRYTRLGLNLKDRENLAENPPAPKVRLPTQLNRINYDPPETKKNTLVSAMYQDVEDKDITPIRHDTSRQPEEEREVLVVEDNRPTSPEVMVYNNNNNKAGRAEEEYDEFLERLRLADFLYTEYSLEEIIYQLAKIMFTQSLTRDNAEAQKALQKFTTFLETEADKGHISRDLEKKVLDVLIASLSDTLAENPELLSAARQSVTQQDQQSRDEKQQVLRKILGLGGGAQSSIPAGGPAAAGGGARDNDKLVSGGAPYNRHQQQKGHIRPQKAQTGDLDKIPAAVFEDKYGASGGIAS